MPIATLSLYDAMTKRKSPTPDPGEPSLSWVITAYIGRTQSSPPATGTICRSPKRTWFPPPVSCVIVAATAGSESMLLDTVRGPSGGSSSTYAVNWP